MSAYVIVEASVRDKGGARPLQLLRKTDLAQEETSNCSPQFRIFCLKARLPS